MISKKQIFIAAIIGIALGFIGGRIPVMSRQSAQIQNLQGQIEQAKKFFPPTPNDIRSVFGAVKEVRGSVLVVEVIPSSPFDESPRIRNITIGKDTKITHSEQKDSALLLQEMISSGKPPSPSRDVPAQLSDIKPGQQVVVAANENIRDRESFIATAISFSVTRSSPNAESR